MKKVLFVITFSIFTTILFAQLKPIDLKCEYLTNPEGVDMQNPRLFWQLKSTENAQCQAAYQIIVATTKENIDKNIGDAFDSRKVNSSQNIQVVYKGKKLNPASEYFWKVKVWDKNKKVSEWSETAKFSTGLFSIDDWKGAQWIAWSNQDEWAKEWWRV